MFAKADLDRPFLTHNADLFATVAPQLEAELKQALASRAIGEQVKGVLKPLLAGRRPGYEDAHSFFRAFHGWEGSPPGEWRERHARWLRSRVVAPTA